MKCKEAIFDMEGLLFDTEQVFQDTWHKIVAECAIMLGGGLIEPYGACLCLLSTPGITFCGSKTPPQSPNPPVS